MITRRVLYRCTTTAARGWFILKIGSSTHLNLLLVSCQISETKETLLSGDEDALDHPVVGSRLEDVVEVFEAEVVSLVERLQHQLVKLDALVDLKNKPTIV